MKRLTDNFCNLLLFNSRISFYLFFIIILLIVLQNYLYFYFTNVFCLVLILLLGISHGSLDHLKGKKLFKILKIENQILFYFFYIILALTVVGLWLFFPSLMLLLFLIVASFHFGKEDSSYVLWDKKIIIPELMYFIRGSIIVIAPLMLNFNETVSLFSNLLPEQNNFINIIYQLKISNENLSLLLILPFIIIFCTGFYIHANGVAGSIPRLTGYDPFIFDFISVILLNASFNPLVAFTIYFCFLHSPRHSLSLINELDKNNFKRGFKMFLKKALPLTIITAIIFILSLRILTNYYVLDDAITKVIFIGLASLTFPHILLEYLLEKNEKQRN